MSSSGDLWVLETSHTHNAGRSTGHTNMMSQVATKQDLTNDVSNLAMNRFKYYCLFPHRKPQGYMD